MNLEPHEYEVIQHTEMSYNDEFPGFIAFFAEEAASVGGETVISDNVAITNNLSSKLKGKLERLGVQYVRMLSDARRKPEHVY